MVAADVDRKVCLKMMNLLICNMSDLMKKIMSSYIEFQLFHYYYIALRVPSKRQSCQPFFK